MLCPPFRCVHQVTQLAGGESFPVSSQCLMNSPEVLFHTLPRGESSRQLLTVDTLHPLNEGIMIQTYVSVHLELRPVCPVIRQWASSPFPEQMCIFRTEEAHKPSGWQRTKRLYVPPVGIREHIWRTHIWA